MNPIVLLCIGIAAAAVGTLGVFALVHARANRRRWARYAMPEGSGKLVPVLCPHCRQRTYSPRAIRESYCPNCGKHH